MFFSALFFATAAAAGPHSIADCEAIQEADAYNRCLASFGPMRGQRGKTFPGMASGGENKGGGAIRRAPRFAQGMTVSHGRAGRVRMEFTPGRR